MLRREELLDEMEKIRSKDPGKRLRPEDVVLSAMSPTSRLHSYFEWDDSEAAERFRVIQARQLIRVTVVVIPSTNEEIRAYCSLKQDRKSLATTGGGYRSMVEVMGDDQLQAILLEDAMSELRAFEVKYRRLRALGPVISAARALRAKEEKKAARAEARKKKTTTKTRTRASRSSAGKKKTTRKSAKAGRK